MLEENDTYRLLELFFKKPLYSFHLRELCRTLDWSPTKVRAGVDALKKKKLITESREKNLSLFRSERQGTEFFRHKMLYNISKALDIAEILEETIGGFEAVIFFGSARRGEDIENSDFDICVVGAKEKDLDFSRIEKEINRKVSLLFAISAGELQKANKELLNNLINGIVVSGYFRVFE